MAKERVVKIPEAQRIFELARSGMTAEKIAEHIGRHRNTVLSVLHLKTPRILRKGSDALNYFSCLIPCRVDVAAITEQALFNLQYVQGRGDWRKHVRLRETFGSDGIVWEYQNIRKKRIPFSRFYIFPTGIYTAFGENAHLKHGQKINVARMIYRILTRIGAIKTADTTDANGGVGDGEDEKLPEMRVHPLDSGDERGGSLQ